MRLRSLLAACCVLLFGVSSAAQSPAGAADPLSGTWTGLMGQSPTNQFPITVELKFDGNAAVTGTITGPPNPGEIKSGTFDSKIGALKLDINVKDGGNTVAIFEGTVVEGLATGRVNVGSNIGYFKIAKGAGGSAAAQPPGANDAAAALRKSFGEVSGWVTKAADLVPADKYTYRPVQSVRTYAQLIAHIADSYNFYCARATGRNVQWSDAIEKGATDKATLVPKLKQSLDGCTAAYGSASQVAPLIENVGHTSLHYGNIITYMRMLGLVPPSS